MSAIDDIRAWYRHNEQIMVIAGDKLSHVEREEIRRVGRLLALVDDQAAEITSLREALDHAEAFFAEAGYLATLAHVRDIARGPVEANQEEAQHGE